MLYSWENARVGSKLAPAVIRRESFKPTYNGFTPDQVSTGRAFPSKKLISNPLAMKASARIYSTSYPRLVQAATGKANISQKTAENDALRLIYAGRIQGQVL